MCKPPPRRHHRRLPLQPKSPPPPIVRGSFHDPAPHNPIQLDNPAGWVGFFSIFRPRPDSRKRRAYLYSYSSAEKIPWAWVDTDRWMDGGRREGGREACAVKLKWKFGSERASERASERQGRKRGRERGGAKTKVENSWHCTRFLPPSVPPALFSALLSRANCRARRARHRSFYAIGELGPKNAALYGALVTVLLSPIAPRARARLPPLHRHTLHGCLTREVPGLRAVRGAHCRELPALYLLIVKSVRHSGHKRKKRREIWSRARAGVGESLCT